MCSPYISGFKHFLRSTPIRSGQLFVRTHTFRTQPHRIILNQSSHRHFTSSSFRNARYVRFNVDPERPFDVRRWDLATKVMGGFVVLGTLYFGAHLERVPETGRWRFIDVSPTKEAKLAKETHEELMEQYKGKILPSNHLITRHVRKVVTRILDSSNLGTLKSDPSFITPPGVSIEDLWEPDSGRREDVVPGSGGREWELMVINDEKTVNAFASFGNIVVFTGILSVAGNEDGLAAILGHEIAHVVARHNAEALSSQRLLLGVAALLEFIGLDFGLARIGTTYLLELPNSRSQELEADEIGLRLSSQACYDPQAARDVQTRLGKAEQAIGRLNVNFLYTHPTSEMRLRLLEKLIPEAYSIQAASPACAGMQENFRAFAETVAFDKLGLGTV